MKIPFWSIIIVAGLAIIAVAAAYLVGRSHADDEVWLLNQELEALRQNELESAVVKRASQQMEDIAYQQKGISDQQRERAEEQSRLALAMRDRAEQESRSARKAQQQALDALSEAELQRSKAEELQFIAEDQRDQATLARSISDTLSYRNLSRTLGTTACTHFESHETELSQLLAYASWYYADRYRGNVYQNPTYQALSSCTNSVHRYFNPQRRSQFEDVTPLDDHTVVAVTAYGEIMTCDNQGIHKLYQDPDNCDFRWVSVIDNKIFALNFRGSLLRLTRQGTVVSYPLSDRGYFSMAQVDDHTLLLGASNSLSWFDLRSNTVTATIRLQGKELSALNQRGNQTLVFYDNAKCEIVEKPGQLAPYQQLDMASEVTATYYDATLHCLCLGLSSGDIVLINDYDNICYKISEHNSSITDLKINRQILLSTSYDKTARVWNLSRLMGSEGGNLNEFTRTAANSSVSQKKSQTYEWLTPAEYTFDKWPLASTFIGDEAWIATSNGVIWRVCTSVDNMSKKLKAALKRNLTETEWNQYIGAEFPYTQFVAQ